MRQDKDRTAKWVPTHHGDSVLRLAGITGFSSWNALQTESVAPRRLPDGLLEVRYPGENDAELVLIEVETYPSGDADRQVFEDLLVLTADRGVVPNAILLVLQPRGQQIVRGTAERTDRRGTTCLTAAWSVVRLWELEADDLFAAGDIGLIPWVPLTRSDLPPEDLLTRCRDVIEAVPDAADRKGLLVVTEILAGLAFPGRKFLKLFGGPELMIESPVLEEAKELIRIRAVRGSLRESIIMFLEGRFGTVPESIRIKIAGIEDVTILQSIVRLSAACPDLTAFATAIESNS